MRIVTLSVMCALAAFAAGESSSVSEAARRVEEQAARLSPVLADQFRAMAAKDLQGRYPDLAKKLRAATAPTAPAVASVQPASGPATGPKIVSIRRRISTMGNLPTDAGRAKLATQLAREIQVLPASAGSNKVVLAQDLCHRSTSSDLGKEALAAVSGALAVALRQSSGGAYSYAYLDLVSLIRYEHAPVPPPDAALEAADAVLALRQALAQEADFTLTGLDGRSYSLSALKGRVVLVNFWTTSCPPCRKEMPDMEKLYRALENKGFTVLAISDEERAKVADFIQKEKYTFPILLDPDREAHEAFGVEGVPKSFVFDRDGKLAAQAIEMRSERQFKEMLKSAGLSVESK